MSTVANLIPIPSGSTAATSSPAASARMNRKRNLQETRDRRAAVALAVSSSYPFTPPTPPPVPPTFIPLPSTSYSSGGSEHLIAILPPARPSPPSVDSRSQSNQSQEPERVKRTKKNRGKGKRKAGPEVYEEAEPDVEASGMQDGSDDPTQAASFDSRTPSQSKPIGEFTMAEICEDIGIGRVSSRHKDVVQAHYKLQQEGGQRNATSKNLLRRKKEWEAKVSGVKYQSSDEEDIDGDRPARRSGEREQSPREGDIVSIPKISYDDQDQTSHELEVVSTLEGENDDAAEKEDEALSARTSRSKSSILSPIAGLDDVDEADEDYGDLNVSENQRHAPQFRLVNGSMVLDEQSMFVDRSNEGDGDEIAWEHVDEGGVRFINSASYSRRGKRQRWSREDTDKFYDAIYQFGTDFEMIARLFSDRSRKDIKNKWNSEEKRNSQLLTDAVMGRRPIDVRAYEEATQKDLSGPTPVIEAPVTDFQLIDNNPSEQATDDLLEAMPASATESKRQPEYTEDGFEIVDIAEDDVVSKPAKGNRAQADKAKARSQRNKTREPGVEVVGQFL